MNFTVSKNEFSYALQIVSHAISSTSPQVTLRGIKIKAENDSLIITGSDADISIEKTLQKNDDNQLNIIEEGSILIDAKYLVDIVKKIDSDIVSVEIIDGALTKFSGNAALFKINGMNAMDYPSIDFSRPESSITMNSSQLSEIIDETAFAATQKDTRPILKGVNFNLNNHILNCTATHSFRLAKKTVKFDVDGTFNITIPSRSLNEVKGTMLLNGDDEIIICQNDKKAQFITNDMILQTRLLDGGYPETDRLIPTEFKYTMKINRSDFISAIDRTSFIKNENMTIDKLECSKDECILTNKSQEIGESHESLAAVFEGEPLKISFDGSYVMQAAKVLKSDEIMIKFTGEMKPFVVVNPEDDSILQLILPVRTYN